MVFKYPTLSLQKSKLELHLNPVHSIRANGGYELMIIILMMIRFMTVAYRGILSPFQPQNSYLYGRSNAKVLKSSFKTNLDLEH